MRISGYSPLSGVSGGKSKKRAGGTGGAFDVGSSEQSHASEATGSAGGVFGIGGLLALQEVDDPLTGRRKATRRGNDLLDTLENLKTDLLAGQVSPDRLGRIALLLSRREDSGNPDLEQVIDEIELRARVELAKLGHY
ncbi:flagellar assembly protein FliX [Stappia sp. ICDLI1TA098]